METTTHAALPDDLDQIVRDLPENATCQDCGKQAADYGTSKNFSDIDPTERNYIEHWSEWEDGEHFIIGSEPEDTYPMDPDGKEWNVCGYCGCARWDTANDQRDEPTDIETPQD
jgi:hypothetical protein